MAVLISAVPPLMVKTDKNPAGAPIAVFDGLRAAYVENRPQFYRDITLPFYGYNRPGAKISEGIREKWWLQGMMGGMKAGYDCIKAFSETDFTEDLKKFDVPTLILHGDDDQIVPIAAAAPLSAKLVKGATLKVYPGFPHGMPTTQADTSMPICSRSSNRTHKKKRRDRLGRCICPGTCTGFPKLTENVCRFTILP